MQQLKQTAPQLNIELSLLQHVQSTAIWPDEYNSIHTYMGHFKLQEDNEENAHFLIQTCNV